MEIVSRNPTRSKTEKALSCESEHLMMLDSLKHFLRCKRWGRSENLTGDSWPTGTLVQYKIQGLNVLVLISPTARGMWIQKICAYVITTCTQDAQQLFLALLVMLWACEARASTPVLSFQYTYLLIFIWDHTCSAQVSYKKHRGPNVVSGMESESVVCK